MLAINQRVDGGRFLVVDVLGKGGSGIAYLALDTHSSPKHPKYYAIKCVPRPASDADCSALLREIRLHKLVTQHPAIVTLKRCIQEGPYQLFIMDFLPGGDLFRQITQQHRFFLNDALITDVFLQIIDAVEYCHENGVYHRDLKPENILCNHDGSRVVLADFGLATRQPVSDDLGVGSGYYMSPECNAGPAYSTVANDLWSLGVILCNLAFGRNPWAQAVSTDATFAAYAANPTYLSAILPTSPAAANILTGSRGLFSLDPRRRMGLAELREQVRNVRRWTMSEEELRFASPEARSVAGVLRNAVRERDAKAAAAAAAAAQTPAMIVPVVAVPSPAPRRQQPLPEVIVVEPVPAVQQRQSIPAIHVPVPVQTPQAQGFGAAHHRNSSLRLVLAKVAAPFRSSTPSSTDSSSSSSQYVAHPRYHASSERTVSRRASMAPSDISESAYSKPSDVSESSAYSRPSDVSEQSVYSNGSSSSESLNSPMPLTPPASAYTSAVDVVYPHHPHQHHHHGQHSRGHHSQWQRTVGAEGKTANEWVVNGRVQRRI